jgi:hypothetical protein
MAPSPDAIAEILGTRTPARNSDLNGRKSSETTGSDGSGRASSRRAR